MDLLALFGSFTHALGMNPFIFLVNLYFILLLIPYIKYPLPLAFLALFVAFLLLSKSLTALFLLWPFELLVVLLVFHYFPKNSERGSGFFWIALGLITLAWVF